MADDKDDDEKDARSIAQRKRWDRYQSQTEQERIADKDLKEARIEEIVKIMRPMAINGKLTWNRDVRKDLAALWGLTDHDIRRLSAEASKRIREDVTDPDELLRSAGEVLLDNLAYAHNKRNVKDIVALTGLVMKLAEGSVQRIEVTVEAKQPTKADAARAMENIFGKRVSNADEKTEAELADSPSTKRGTPED